MTTLHRVVTVTGPGGKSAVLIEDGGANDLASKSFPGLVMREIWSSEDQPGRIDAVTDQSLRPTQIEPSPGGSRFRIIELPPEPDPATLQAGDVAAEMGLLSVSPAQARQRHHSVHATRTLDYLVVLSGEMWLLLDEGEVLLRAGSCVVQQGTMHGFTNRSQEPCVFAAVLIDAPPRTGNGPAGEPG